MSELIQQSIMGEEESGQNFFAPEVGAFQVVFSQSMRSNRNREERVILPEIYHFHQYSNWRGYQQRGGEWQIKGKYNFEQVKKVKYMEKKTENPIKKEVVPRPQPITTAKQVTESGCKDLSEDLDERLNIAYIQGQEDSSFDSKCEKIETSLMSLLEQSQREQQGKRLGIPKECEPSLVSIDLNPKQFKKTKNQKQFLQICHESLSSDENSKYLLGLNESSASNNSKSLSYALSEQSINLNEMISKQLSKYSKIQDLKNSPERQITVKLRSNAFIKSVKLKSFRIKPIKQVLTLNECKRSEIIVLNETQYDLPNNQYREQTRILNLCTMNVPEMSSKIIEDENYFELLAQQMLHIETMRLQCASCRAHNNAVVKQCSNTASESCRNCSATLIVVIEQLRIKQS